MSITDAEFRPLSDDQLGAAFHEAGGSARTDYLTDIVAQAGRTRQRPAWTFPERWLPMTIALRPAAVPRAVIHLALLVALLALLGFTYLLSGASPSVPPPMPVVQNGLLAIEYGGDIHIAQPDGSGRKLLIGGDVVQGSPVWSTDGARLAYTSATPGSIANLVDLVVVNADGSHPITVASGIESIGGVAWSPDGSTIAYSAQVTPGEAACPGYHAQNGDFCWSRIFVAPTDGSGAHQVGDPDLDGRSPAWSPDGQTIAFGAGNASQEIRAYLMDPDGANVRPVGTPRGTDWAFVAVDWSHDGTKIVGQASAADDIGEWDIWVINADGSGDTDVGAHLGTDEIIPSWAPDRDALAWWSNGTIVLLEPGGEPVDLPVDGIPAWSPDGRFLTTVTDPRTLQVLDLRGDIQMTVPDVTSFDWQPVVTGS